MILNKFLFDKEIAIVLLMCNANEYCQGLCQSSKIILCEIIHLIVRGFCENLITDSSFAVVDTSNFFDDD